ncbi:hypothetical protein [Bradyrhizobium japonicum]|uniref:hypothetical protein n=1 Tax=Bradyrhizobium japonicum TaxID=375 RepID=UPI001FD87F31|nr:hypothetical protein [Bradyrhizobium japonicum]WLB97027.1 hypothetical protein QIH92_47320 [Bradyrhizobium japonicum USDA 123]
MRETPREVGAALTRRSLLMAAPAILVSPRASRAQGGNPAWPPVFETGRSQYGRAPRCRRCGFRTCMERTPW